MPDGHIEIDERFMPEWVGYGVAQLEAYLSATRPGSTTTTPSATPPATARPPEPAAQPAISGRACLRVRRSGRTMPPAIQASTSANSSSTSRS
jgi:hypothetical protein